MLGSYGIRILIFIWGQGIVVKNKIKNHRKIIAIIIVFICFLCAGGLFVMNNKKPVESAVAEGSANINESGSIDKISNNTVDLVIFMGQSNMAGRGTASEAPVVPKEYGYEFRAISDPTKLYNIVEPFGVNENKKDAVDEPGKKTGSLVSAFTIAYYNEVKVPIVGVSSSKGGTSIKSWQPNSSYLNDSIDRFKKAESYLLNNGYNIRKKFMVWCQGESDGDKNMAEEDYKTKLQAMMEEMFKNGVEECFLIRIGNHRDLPEQYSSIIKAQTDFCESYDKAILVSTKFAEMASKGLMKDSFHYKQDAYNIVGTEAGKNTAFYILNSKKPALDIK